MILFLASVFMSQFAVAISAQLKSSTWLKNLTHQESRVTRNVNRPNPVRLLSPTGSAFEMKKTELNDYNRNNGLEWWLLRKSAMFDFP